MLESEVKSQGGTVHSAPLDMRIAYLWVLFCVVKRNENRQEMCWKGKGGMRNEGIKKQW